MGEITLQDEFGQQIYKTVRENGYKVNLEIGSWDGTGSTNCFYEAMKDMDRKFLFCIEFNSERCEEFFKQPHLIQDWIALYCGSSISKEEFLPKSFDEIWESPYNKHKDIGVYSKELVQTWYEDDLKNLNARPLLKGVISTIINNDQSYFDAVLIDGGEFAGYSEYQLLKDKVKCFMLDDVHKAYKCNQIYEELKSNPDWILVSENPEVRNGYAIFKRI